MRLARLGPPGEEIPAALVGDAWFVDLSDVVKDVDGAFLAGDGPRRIADLVAKRVSDGLVESVGHRRYGPPVARPHQIVAIGLNYVDHAAEAGVAVPEQPVVFSKSPNSMVGPHDDIVVPAHASQLDYEVELAVVIGRPAYALPDRESAAGVIAGYMALNDVSERAWQMAGGQWVKGKSAPTFCPCGPFLATPDEVPEPGALALRLEVNGEVRQSASTADMVFDIPYLVHHVSHFIALEPGDVIATGTPPGVALGMRPPQWLEVGDVVTLSVQGLGEQRSHVRAATTPQLVP